VGSLLQWIAVALVSVALVLAAQSHTAREAWRKAKSASGVERARCAQVRAESAGEHARGYATGHRAAVGDMSRDVEGVKRAVNAMAAGCVFLPQSQRVEVSR